MAVARFTITGEVQHVGLRANIISFASENHVMAKVRNSIKSRDKVYVIVKGETAEEIFEFYKKVKDEDMRERYKVKDRARKYYVDDIEYINRGEQEHDWGEYFQMVQAEAALKTMACLKRMENIAKKSMEYQIDDDAALTGDTKVKRKKTLGIR